jgi:thiol:disulfide interchange protein DsbD
VPDGRPFRAAGELKPPKPLRKYDQSFNLDVGYYDREATFRIPVRLDSASTAPLHGKVHFQACNDKLCLPPRTLTVITAKEHKSGYVK